MKKINPQSFIIDVEAYEKVLSKHIGIPIKILSGTKAGEVIGVIHKEG